MKKIEIVGKTGKIEIVIKGKLNFQIFKNWGIQIFPIKREGLVKLGELFLKRWGIIYFHTN